MNRNLGHDGNDKEDVERTKAFRLKESQLRKRLEEKPKNSKLMSELAVHLAQRSYELASKDNKSYESESERLQKEAIALAKRAIQTAPQKPFGYAALSTIYPADSAERMTMLQQTISLSEKEDKHTIALIGLLVRQIVEPRELESRRVQGQMGKASQRHPSRRQMSSAEDSVYGKLQIALAKAWGSDDDGLFYRTTSDEQKKFVAQQEYKLGLFFRKKDPVRARQHLTDCMKHYPTIPETSLSTMAHFWLGTLEKSTEIVDFDDGEKNSNNNSNNHNIQVCRCPPEYIVGLYSTFAERFDELLVKKLEYKTPTKLRQLFDRTVICGNELQHGLDLGCGTGISGLAFQDVVHKMDGVDLSPEMIAKARERKCYDSLKVADVVNALESDNNGSQNAYDLILACDVFCYIGDLSSVFASVKRLLSHDGYFCFSTELLRHDDGTSDNNPQTEDDDREPFRLHCCARFSHTEHYVLQLANKYDFDIVGKELADCLRKNQGANVEGMLTILQPR